MEDAPWKPLQDQDSFCAKDILLFLMNHRPKGKIVRHYRRLHVTIYDYLFEEASKRQEAVEDVWRIWDFLTNILKHREPNQLVDIVMFWTPFRKYMRIGEALGQLGWSSGECTHRSVRMWRYEEWRKVLFHELLHVLEYKQHTKNEESWVEYGALLCYTLFLSSRTEQEAQKKWELQVAHTKALARRFRRPLGLATRYIIRVARLMPRNITEAMQIFKTGHVRQDK